ncbi:MAG: Rrf2 family transcriptional regulator [Kiritimatiellae bacterium]|nr:Rrf2 family transcriptional regulator [Kiritimatiellia bacterium]
MNLINRDTDYAVRALRFLAQRPGEILSVADLHAELGIPRAYLRGILQKLARAEILRSHRGQRGGFQLNRQPATIQLLDLMELFQGDVSLTQCMFHGEACPNRAVCPLRATIKEIEELVATKLRDITIASLGTHPEITRNSTVGV